MAIGYDAWKKSYSGMNDEQKQKYNDTMQQQGGDALARSNEFIERYNQEMEANKPVSTEQSVSNQGKLEGSGDTKNRETWNQTEGQSYSNLTNEKQSDGGWESMRYDDRKKEYDKLDDKSKKEYSNFLDTQSDDYWGRGFLDTYNQEKTVSPDLDVSKFNEAPGEISVKEGTAQQTGRPDYQANTQARLDEMKRNLDQYFAESPWMFSDRETFNRVFEYDSRDSEAQKQLLDSYWKRKQDMDVASNYTNGATIIEGMKNAKITSSQLNLIKEYNPEAYREWQQKQLDDINLRIANLATPADPTDTAELFNSLVNKLGLEPGDPYQIYDNWYSMCERLGVFSDSEKLKSYQSQLDANHSKMESIMSRYSASTGGTVSDALAAARMSKALAPYQQREVDLQNSYTTLLNGRNSNLAVANQSANALAMQAQEDQRIWNQRYQALGFAMNTASWRSPEQQAQLQLQTAQIQNDMSLLNQSRSNDLALYNQYATAKLQNQLNSELTDLSVTDPNQLRANLNNVLSQYYSQWGDIIERPQSQVIDDVLAYAKANNVSVAEALRKNFVIPLQNKTEYKNAIAGKYPTDTSSQQSWEYIDNGDGTTSLRIKGVGEIPGNLTRQERVSAYKDIYKEMGGNVGTFAIALSQAIPDKTYAGWCGEFVNDYLVALGLKKENGFGDYLDQKMGKRNTEEAVLGGVAIMDFGVTDENGKPYGHVGIIVGKNSDGSLVICDSNRAGDKVKLTHTLSAADVKKYVKGYYDPNKDLPKQGNKASSITDDEIYNYNDTTLNRKLKSEQRQKVMDAKNEVYSNPDSSIEDILRFSQGGKTPTDSTVQSLDKYAQALTSLGQLTELLKDANTGPIIGALRSKNPYDVKAREINVAIAGLLPTLARGVYGEVGVLTDKDIEHYSQTVPNLKSTEDVNDAILAMSLDLLADGYKRKLATQASLGYDVSGMAGIYQQIIGQAEALRAGIGISENDTINEVNQSTGPMYTPIYKTSSFSKYKNQ